MGRRRERKKDLRGKRDGEGEGGREKSRRGAGERKRNAAALPANSRRPRYIYEAHKVASTTAYIAA